MGNCCLKDSRSSVWAETDDENDQWVYYSDPDLQQKERLLSEEKTENKPNSSLVSVNENNREVKIMMSKKKLGELLGKMEDIPNIAVDQILDRLLYSIDRFEFYDDHHKQQQHAWKPNLSSIPEENYNTF